LKLHNLPPFFPTLFSTAPQNEGNPPQIAQNARIAFCGNGFIHLNIAEIYEEIIGGQKKCAPIGKLSSKWAILVPSVEIMLKIIKKSITVLPKTKNGSVVGIL